MGIAVHLNVPRVTLQNAMAAKMGSYYKITLALPAQQHAVAAKMEFVFNHAHQTVTLAHLLLLVQYAKQDFTFQTETALNVIQDVQHALMGPLVQVVSHRIF
jgi:hypothetical protein